MIGGVLTAMVTPFGADGRLDEEAAAQLIRHLLRNGSDGVVLAGTTGEGPTLTDDEDVAPVDARRGGGRRCHGDRGHRQQRHPRTPSS